MPPEPAAAATAPAELESSAARNGPGSRVPRPADAVHPLPAAAPTRLDIPAIDVTSDLLRLGLNPDDTIQVPPLSEDAPTS